MYLIGVQLTVKRFKMRMCVYDINTGKSYVLARRKKKDKKIKSMKFFCKILWGYLRCLKTFLISTGTFLNREFLFANLKNYLCLIN